MYNFVRLVSNEKCKCLNSTVYVCLYQIKTPNRTLTRYDQYDSTHGFIFTQPNSLLSGRGSVSGVKKSSLADSLYTLYTVALQVTRRRPPGNRSEDTFSSTPTLAQDKPPSHGCNVVSDERS